MSRLPETFLDYLQGILAPKDLQGLIATSGDKPRLSIRANTAKLPANELKALFDPKGISLEPIPWCPEGFYLPDKFDSSGIIGNLLLHHIGLFYIQEASSMLPVQALFDGLEIGPGFRILDMAASPGSKTTQISSKLGHDDFLLANEISSSRLMALHANIIRMGVSNVALSHNDAASLTADSIGYFDAILVDAPCTGEGTFRKDPKALLDWRLENAEALAKTQLEILRTAQNLLKPGGSLVYSTCTINGLENEEVCQQFLTLEPSMSPSSLKTLFTDPRGVIAENQIRLLPHHYQSEPFFIAKFKKSETEAFTQQSPSVDTIVTTDIKCFALYVKEAFGIDLDTKRLSQKGENIFYLTSDGRRCKRLNRYGIKVSELKKSKRPNPNKRNNHNFNLTHEFVSVFGHLATKNTVDLLEELALDYLQGKDVNLPVKSESADVILTVYNQPLGMGKIVNNKIKNKLPRHLVKDQRLLTLDAIS